MSAARELPDDELPDDESPDELARLVSALADGTLDAAEEARLVVLLGKDPSARAKYYDHVMLAALLRREGRRAAAQGNDQWPRTDDAPRPVVAALTSRRRPWLIVLAATVLLCLLLSVGEATGVTRLVPHLIRIVTGEGSLVIEVDDPSVAVTLDGADITITGAGIHELRLRPGAHKLVATKDGRPISLERDLVTITRGGQQIVRVRLEAEAAAANSAKAGSGAFVVLGGKAALERRFATLADAVLAASAGDTIEIRGNGPFVSAPIRINEALAIRAADGFRPVIQLSKEHPDAHLLTSFAPLVLEGLELQRPPRHQEWTVLLATHSGPLYVANCRFLIAAEINGLAAYGPGLCVVRNSEILSYGKGGSLTLNLGAGHRCIFDNCIFARTNIELRCDFSRLDNSSVVLKRNTALRAGGLINFHLAPESRIPIWPFPVSTSASIFATDDIVWLRFHESTEAADQPVSLPRWLKWSGERNVYDVPHHYWSASHGDARPLVPALPSGTLAEWKQLWPASENGSLEGRVRFNGGELHSKVAVTPGQVTPEDFRLRPDSAGYRAGPDGKDLGADIDLVGPGAGYERWKKTPEYEEWLNESGRKK